MAMNKAYLLTICLLLTSFTGCLDYAEEAEEKLPDEVKCLLIVGEYEILDLEITPAAGMSSGDEKVVKGHIKFSDSEYDADTEKCNTSYNIVDADSNLHVNSDNSAYEYMAEISGTSSNMVIIDTDGSIILGDDIEEYSGSLENSGNITLSGIAVLVPCNGCFDDAKKGELVVGIEGNAPGEGKGCIDYEDTNDNGLYDEGEPCNDDEDEINFKPENRAELKTAVDEWKEDSDSASSTYGDINTWNTSLITSMSSLFYNEDTFGDTFNDDISDWDVSSVTDMSWMFFGANRFNQDISDWDVSSVTDMNSMFMKAESFNQDISDWDVSSVTNMNEVFANADSFNQDISEWDVSSVTDMSYMFYNADSFNGDISGWDVSNVTDMEAMFFRAYDFNGNISDWDVSSVTDMDYMFDNTDDLSDDNKCAIHTSFSSNDNWPYDWEEYCSD